MTKHIDSLLVTKTNQYNENYTTIGACGIGLPSRRNCSGKVLLIGNIVELVTSIHTRTSVILTFLYEHVLATMISNFNSTTRDQTSHC